MFGSKKVKLDKEVMAKVRRYAALAGYSSPEEFIQHALDGRRDLWREVDGNRRRWSDVSDIL